MGIIRLGSRDGREGEGLCRFERVAERGAMTLCSPRGPWPVAPSPRSNALARWEAAARPPALTYRLQLPRQRIGQAQRVRPGPSFPSSRCVGQAARAVNIQLESKEWLDWNLGK